MSSLNKKILLPLLALAMAVTASAQRPVVGRSTSAVIVVDTIAWTHNGFKLPVFIDTTHALTAAKVDSIGLIFKEYGSNNVWYRDSTYDASGLHLWVKFGSGGSSITYPRTTTKYLNGYGNFPALNTDSIAQGTTNKFDSGYQVLYVNLPGNIPIAKAVDGSGHRFVLIDTNSLAHPWAMMTEAGTQKKIDSLLGVINTATTLRVYRGVHPNGSNGINAGEAAVGQTEDSTIYYDLGNTGSVTTIKHIHDSVGKGIVYNGMVPASGTLYLIAKGSDSALAQLTLGTNLSVSGGALNASGGGSQTLQQVFNQQNPAVLTVSDTIDAATNSVPLVVKGNMIPSAPQTYNLGSGANNYLAINTNQANSNHNLAFGVPTGFGFNWAINGVIKEQINSAGQFNLLSSPLVPTLALGSRVMVDPVADTLAFQAEILHQPVRLATAAALPTNTYSNGTAGVGATLTATTNGALTVDGVAVVANDRILVKNEAAPANNGLYIVTQAGSGGTPYILTRGGYSSIAANMTAGSHVYVQAGTANAMSVWYQQTTGAITFGTTALSYGSASGGGGLTSFTSPNSTISIGGTLTAPTVDINLANPNTWPSTQTFSTPMLPSATTSIAFGSNAKSWSTGWFQNITSPGALGLGAASGSAINQSINGVTKDATLSTGQKQYSGYGSGTFTGTATFNLSVDATGHVIETSTSGSGVATDVVQTITAGPTVTVNNGTNVLQVNATSVIASLTVTLPTTWHNSNNVMIAFTSNGSIANGSPMVTTLSIVNGAGQTLSYSSAPTTASAGETIIYHLIGTVDQRTN